MKKIFFFLIGSFIFVLFLVLTFILVLLISDHQSAKMLNDRRYIYDARSNPTIKFREAHFDYLNLTKTQNFVSDSSLKFDTPLLIESEYPVKIVLSSEKNETIIKSITLTFESPKNKFNPDKISHFNQTMDQYSEFLSKIPVATAPNFPHEDVLQWLHEKVTILKADDLHYLHVGNYIYAIESEYQTTPYIIIRRTVKIYEKPRT